MKAIAISLLVLLITFPSIAQAQDFITIEMTENRFSPREITIPTQGGTVTFINRDKVDRWPASNIHPTHGIYPEFDPKRPIKPGESWSFKFEKAGQWRYHDHLLPHVRGVVGVEDSLFARLFGWFKDKVITVITFIKFIKREEPIQIESSSQFGSLENIIRSQGFENAWKYVSNHDEAHYFGARLYEKMNFSGISFCSPSFAFGCYHGFTDAALSKSLDPLKELSRACESLGQVGGGPWASCIHGIGHGVATYFDTLRLIDALSACDRLEQGFVYCHDGVFMEFATNAPQKFYKLTDPLYPCNAIEEKYKEGCARNQPTVLEAYLNMNLTQIAKICLDSRDQKIRHNCIDAIGLKVGQKSNGDSKLIINGCSVISETGPYSQCIWAAAGEIVFQNFKGWQIEAFKTCKSLAEGFKRQCQERVERLVKDYSLQ